jgi:hypothetical protein
MPASYDDFILLTRAEELELLLSYKEDEPSNYQEAKSSPEWIQAMREELNAIEKNKTWQLSDLPKGIRQTEVGIQAKKDCQWVNQQAESKTRSKGLRSTIRDLF